MPIPPVAPGWNLSMRNSNGIDTPRLELDPDLSLDVKGLSLFGKDLFFFLTYNCLSFRFNSSQREFSVNQAKSEQVTEK